MGQPVEMYGKPVTLLAATVVSAAVNTAGFTGAVIDGLDKSTMATLLLTISSKTWDAGTTLDIYVQYSPDVGTTWDDIAHFAQITNAAMGNGTYVMFLTPGAAGVADRATDDAATLAANSVRNIHWCDRMRIKAVATNVAGTDTVTTKVDAYFR